MQRVMIIGQPGSGKSTLARALGAATGLPIYHLDHIHWTPGWVEREREAKTEMVRKVHALPKWIFEGGLSATWPERLECADTLIWLDFGLAVRVARVVRRTLRHYGQTRPDLPENCPERFNAEFYQFIWQTRRSAREKIKRLVASAGPEKTVLRFTTIGQIDEYLTGLNSH